MKTKIQTLGIIVAILVVASLVAVPTTLAEDTATITFSGYTWTVRGTPQGEQGSPGQCFYSSSSQNVWTDAQGLHLAIAWHDDRWTTAEVYTQPLGYGTYLWQTTGSLIFDSDNVNFAMFTYDKNNVTGTGGAHNEMDIEFSGWDNRTWYIANNHYGPQYSVHPFNAEMNGLGLGSGNIENVDYNQYMLPNEAPYQYTHAIVWNSTGQRFITVVGHYNTTTQMLNATTIVADWYHEGARDATNSFADINFWLIDNNHDGYGDAPTVEPVPSITINKFVFTPSHHTFGDDGDYSIDNLISPQDMGSLAVLIVFGGIVFFGASAGLAIIKKRRF